MTVNAANRLAVTDHDSWPWIGWSALIALVAAMTLALLGLPPVDLHSPLHQMGIMDPLCGGTRAARFFMTGDWASAWQFNPGIFVLSAVLGLGLARWVYGRATRRWLRLDISRRGVGMTLIIGVLILEINQQVNAELLMQT